MEISNGLGPKRIFIVVLSTKGPYEMGLPSVKER